MSAALSVRLKTTLVRQPIWAFVVLVFVFFSLISDHFLSVGNLSNVLIQTSTIGLFALGMTMVMINGNIDLSVGATLGRLESRPDAAGIWRATPATAHRRASLTSS